MPKSPLLTGFLPLVVIGLGTVAVIDYANQSRRAALDGRELSFSDYASAFAVRAWSEPPSSPTAAVERRPATPGWGGGMVGTPTGTMEQTATGDSTGPTDAQIGAMMQAADAELVRMGLIDGPGPGPEPGSPASVLAIIEGGDGRAMEAALDEVAAQEAASEVVIRRSGQIDGD
ncbi:hypothetical protein [Wenxinia marina]|uniref:Uncharacterized protein n=1 Tax=Wenxinia marina DSM 24838 TaxID=1123501 RepID=A0A0D0P7J8_9RHOB|nr:hypothetical protein [Wenxinia marina]KIQ67566.1 hypothetical protein Wenmar_03992 [Wenxinia marina DSM 24838]GGL68423.1 hypothetical protein GCM10011392_23650 [Wenxinia marina]